MLGKLSNLMTMTSLVVLNFMPSAAAKVDLTVSVTGTATTQVIPDLVVWRLTTTSTNARLVTSAGATHLMGCRSVARLGGWHLMRVQEAAAQIAG